MKNYNLKKEILKMMIKIRTLEEEIAKKYDEQKMRCPTHLSIGQEAVPATISSFLTDKDFAVSTHRGHAHYIAKGGNIKAMISEIYGKETGCSKGKGGSMHLIDKKVGFMGTSAIVGNSIPIGVGLALSSKINDTNQISCVFFGDGAVEEGVFYESVNFAALHKLPVLFICENNLYSVYSPLSVRQPKGRIISDMVSGFGLETEHIDGNNILDKYEIIEKLVAYVRSGNGPIFLEFETYRWLEHCGNHNDDDLGYRSKEEIDFWINKDPIKIAEEKLKIFNDESVNEIKQYKKTIAFEVKEAFIYAEQSPFPDQKNAYKDVFAKKA